MMDDFRDIKKILIDLRSKINFLENAIDEIQTKCNEKSNKHFVSDFVPVKKYNKDLLSNKEAAEFLGVKPNTLAVWKCTKRYNLPCIQVGRHIKYRLKDLEEFLNSRIVVPDQSNFR